MGDVATLIANATRADLGEDDWALVLDCCDAVSSNVRANTPVAIGAVIGCLRSDSRNTQLRALTLLHALARNCGTYFFDSLADASLVQCFTDLVTSPQTDVEVKVKLTEAVEQLVERPEENTSASTLDALTRSISGSTSAPAGDEDDEDADLRRAIELSLREQGAAQPSVSATPAAPGTLFQVRALYDFTATEPGELTFKTDDVISVTDKVYKEWWKGRLGSSEGIFPANYVEKIEQQALPEPDDEQQILAQGAVVEQLLAILAQAAQSPDGARVIEEEHVQDLYHQVAVLRPVLVQTIGRYCVKVQELFVLNQKLTQARRTYDDMTKAATASARSYPFAGAQPRTQPFAAPAVLPHASGQPFQTAAAFAPPAATGPQFVQPITTGPQYVQPTTTGPQYVQPTTTGPQYVQPATTGPQYVQPTATGPQYVQPATTGPQYVPPTSTGHQYAQPTTPGPQYVQASTTGPQYVQPTTTGPQLTGQAPLSAAYPHTSPQTPASGDVPVGSAGAHTAPATYAQQNPYAQSTGFARAQRLSTSSVHSQPASPPVQQLGQVSLETDNSAFYPPSRLPYPDDSHAR